MASFARCLFAAVPEPLRTVIAERVSCLVSAAAESGLRRWQRS